MVVLNVKASAGTRIDIAIEEATQVATRLGCWVDLCFNDRSIMCYPAKATAEATAKTKEEANA